MRTGVAEAEWVSQDGEVEGGPREAACRGLSCVPKFTLWGPDPSTAFGDGVFQEVIKVK